MRNRSCFMFLFLLLQIACSYTYSEELVRHFLLQTRLVLIVNVSLKKTWLRSRPRLLTMVLAWPSTSCLCPTRWWAPTAPGRSAWTRWRAGYQVSQADNRSHCPPLQRSSRRSCVTPRGSGAAARTTSPASRWRRGCWWPTSTRAGLSGKGQH